MKNYYFLFFDGDLITGDAPGFSSLKAACDHYQAVALDLYRYGQTIGANLHVAPDLSGVVECPDFVLSLGPRGGVIKTGVY